MSTPDHTNDDSTAPEHTDATPIETPQPAAETTAPDTGQNATPTDAEATAPAAEAPTDGTDATQAAPEEPSTAAEPEEAQATENAHGAPGDSPAEETATADAPEQPAPETESAVTSAPDTEAPASASEIAQSAPDESATEETAPVDASPAAAGAGEASAPAAETAETTHGEAAPATAGEAAAATPTAAEESAAPTDAPESAPAAPVPTPAAVPKPRPMPRPTPAAVPHSNAPVTPAAPVVPTTSSAEAERWGRIEPDGTVAVHEGDDWRVVGEYPDGTPEEALAYFARKFNDLEVRVVTLEQRHATGGASASDLRRQAAALKGEVVGAAAVGDLVGLAGRLDALTDALAEASEEEAAANRAALDAAIAERESIVVKVEELAARDPKQVQWKQASAELDAIFADWQNHQKTGPRLPKSVAQALWKRFRDSRATFERNRRAFFAQLDEQHKTARDRKARIVERAEALAPQGEQGIPSYRALLDEWKAAGRAGRKTDDSLWARFKAAGDLLYGARAERDAAEQAESQPRIAAREELLLEAAAVADEKDLVKARKLLTNIQDRWEEVGRIFPREAERALDGKMRQIEQDLKRREEVDWKKNDPRTRARANDMSQQLEEAIAALEADLSAAEATGDKRRIDKAREALEARRAWLRAIG
ncbi:DUF349 domain-containing protein [Microbacterium sp. JB110]|uniref:DUF349 domain-containing protein n=1 Tax=Microbacterium sp. JB110 TaxID=2024477 RepID=UPI00097EF700|nr:DUF349 domain-containing protein [Microbacterium sp. JB110]SJM61684.1 ATPase involved in DNA repair [Frigoribacterium sp. JB110]